MTLGDLTNSHNCRSTATQEQLLLSLDKVARSQAAASSMPGGLQHHGEKRGRAMAGLGTPLRSKQDTALATAATTPSVQQPKRTRDARQPARLAGSAITPDPSTPRQQKSVQTTEPPGSADACTPVRSPTSSARRAGLRPAVPSRLGQSPGMSPSAAPAAALPKTFTAVHGAWMEKQEYAFQQWVNGLLQPVAAAPLDAGHALLASSRLAARVRGLLWRIYSKDSELISVMVKVEQRIDGGQLRIRDEEGSLKNLREQARAKAVLMSYHPFWLQLGMEIVVGRPLAGQDARPTATELEHFLREQFMRDPTLARLHAPNKGISGLYPPAYWVEMGKLVLKRFLLLVTLLDRVASQPELPRGTPLLFRTDAKLKGSADVLTEFLQRLVGEGDVLRSLGRLGFKVQYYQHPRREFNFQVDNLARDMRDGLRLCKLTEVLATRPGLFESARFPSDKRPLRLHNVGLALSELAKAGLSLEGICTQHRGVVTLQPADVVDGDREKTLALLWRLVLRFQLPELVNVSAVRMEIERIKGLGNSSEQEQLEGVFAGAGRQQLAVLLAWVQAVSARFGVGVRDFSSSFMDGSVFCLVVHYYLGHTYIPLKDVYLPALPASKSGQQAEERKVQWTDENQLDGEQPWVAAAGAPADVSQATEHEEGRCRNFELMHKALASLGGVPLMVRAQDGAGQGPDEKAVILFLAFLCQRLLEVTREERAAMVMQRLWRQRAGQQPFSMRQHLHAWQAAAARVQRAVRAWLLRRRLARFAAEHRHRTAAATLLQAAWRARPVRLDYQRMRQAAMQVQAAWRGRQGRLLAFQALVLPPLLEHGLQRKRELEARRRSARMQRAATKVQSMWRGRAQRQTYLHQRAAAVLIQAAVRRRLAQVYFQRQCAAALLLQRLWRGRQARQWLAQQQAAAVALQAAWRRHALQRRYQQLRAAALVLQAAERARQARLLLQQHKAAQQVQAAWRGYALRQELAMQRAAAISIQAAWRCRVARTAYLQQWRAAVLIQTAVRCHAARVQYLKQRQAAIILQACWRGFALRHLLARHQAATMLQRCIRGWLVRQSLTRQTQAAVVIQRAMRAHLERKRLAAIQAMREQMAELARTMREFQRRTAAALRIQAVYQGYLGRKEAARLRAELLERQRQREAAEAAACAVIASWAATFSARTKLLRARRAVRVLQRWWSREYARRQAAAVTIQAAARRMVAMQQLERSRTAAVAIQAAWRGHQTRVTHPARKRLATMRNRLAAAWAAAAGCAHRSLGARTAAAVDVITRSAPGTVPAAAVLERLAQCTEAAKGCCDLVAAGGGIPVLLEVLRSVQRSKQHADLLRWTLLCLANIGRWKQHAAAVFMQEDLPLLLGDHMQQQREREDIFLAATQLAQRLVADPARALAISRRPEVVQKLEGVARLLALKQATDRKYVQRLEVQKGSDASARAATRNLVASTRQLAALSKVLAAIGISTVVVPGTNTGELGIGKNTLVRAVLSEMQRPSPGK